MEATLAPVAGPVEQDVLGLGEEATVGFLVERRRRQEQAAAEELRGVAHWADLHRADLNRAEGFVPLALRGGDPRGGTTAIQPGERVGGAG